MVAGSWTSSFYTQLDDYKNRNPSATPALVVQDAATTAVKKANRKTPQTARLDLVVATTEHALVVALARAVVMPLLLLHVGRRVGDAAPRRTGATEGGLVAGLTGEVSGRHPLVGVPGLHILLAVHAIDVL